MGSPRESETYVFCGFDCATVADDETNVEGDAWPACLMQADNREK